MAPIPQIHREIFGSVRLKLGLLEAQAPPRPQLLRDAESLEDLALPPDEDVIRDGVAKHVEQIIPASFHEGDELLVLVFPQGILRGLSRRKGVFDDPHVDGDLVEGEGSQDVHLDALDVQAEDVDVGDVEGQEEGEGREALDDAVGSVAWSFVGQGVLLGREVRTGSLLLFRQGKLYEGVKDIRFTPIFMLTISLQA